MITLELLDSIRQNQTDLLFAKRNARHTYGEESPEYRSAKHVYDLHEIITLTALRSWWSQGCKNPNTKES